VVSKSKRNVTVGGGVCLKARFLILKRRLVKADLEKVRVRKVSGGRGYH